MDIIRIVIGGSELMVGAIGLLVAGRVVARILCCLVEPPMIGWMIISPIGWMVVSPMIGWVVVSPIGWMVVSGIG